MSRGYLARLIAWSGLVVGSVWVAAEGFARTAPADVGPAAHRAAANRALTLSADPGDDAETERHGVFRFLSRVVNQPVAFARENWVFLAEITILSLLGWGSLARGLGVYDLVYSEAKWVRFVNGLITGLMFGNLWFVAYLTNQDSIPWAVADTPTLFPAALDGPRAAEAMAVRQAGNFLLFTWVPTLLIAYLPGAVRYRFGHAGTDRYPAVGLGMLTSVVLTVALVFVAWSAVGGAGDMLADWRFWYAQLPGPRAGKIQPNDYPLHLFASVATVLPLVGLAAAGVVAFLGRVACPVWVVCLLLWLFNSGYGFAAFHFAGSQYVLLGFAVAAAVVANGRHPYKLSLPNLRPEYDAARTGDPIRLSRPAADALAVPLLPAEELLARFCEDWQRAHGPATRPRLVVVAAAGGGIRSAVWTAAVLEGMERVIGPTFGRHVRLIAGSSGGMMAAGLYAASRVHPLRNPSLACAVGEDSLWPTIQTMVVRDLPSAFVPFYRDWDRGRSLEAAWHRNVRPLKPGGKLPFRTTFAELLPAERDGLVPSLIFSPTLVEDGRRLLVSNLDLGDLVAESAPTLSAHQDGKTAAEKAELSRSAFEFFRLFPAAHGRFEVGTAARLSATFPFVSPGVSLPTEPPRRVVDAGYFDNYGIDLIALWLHRHRAAVKEYCSGVAVVEVRGFPLEAEKTGLGDAEHSGGGPVGPVITALAGISTPAEALVNSRAAAYFRNDQLLGILDAEFNPGRAEPFFVRVPLECPGAAALSWSLTTRDREQIIGCFECDGGLSQRVAAEVRGLKAWFGDGGR
jgi:hypothetical protein